MHDRLNSWHVALRLWMQSLSCHPNHHWLLDGDTGRTPNVGFVPVSSRQLWCSVMSQALELPGVFRGAVGLTNSQKRWRKAVKWAPYPLLSCLLAFPSSSPLLLPKGRRRSKEADMKGMPEIVFLDALSLFSLPHRYGNVESQIQLAPMMHIVCLSLIFLFFPRLFAFSPPPHLNPSSSSPSILSSLLQPSGF